MFLLAVLLICTSGCAAEAGFLSATSWGAAGNAVLSGRARPSVSMGLGLSLPVVPAEEEGDLGLELGLGYEQFLADMDDSSNLSEGRWRSQSASAVLRLLHVNKVDPAARYMWVGLGPEYRWSSFVPSDYERVYAALNGIIYDENIGDSWGGCVTVGYDLLPKGWLLIELTYHWFSTRTEVEGINGGVPFKWSRREGFEWISCFVGVRLRF